MALFQKKVVTEEPKEEKPATIVCPACGREKINMSAMSAEIISGCARATGFAWWQMQRVLNRGLKTLR